MPDIILSIGNFGAGQMLALCLALLCLLVSGFVSGSEMAYFSLTDQQLQQIGDDEKGDGVVRLMKKPQQLLATILIANNLVNVTIVVLTNYALGPVFSSMSPVLSFVLQTVILTFVILLFGEIIPKLLANNYNERWAFAAAAPLGFIYRLLSPAAKLLVKSGTLVRKVVVKRPSDITTDELSRALEITQGASGDDKEMLEGILKFGDTAASEIMTPRVDITDLRIDMSFDKVMEIVLASGY